jgi:hypothetical protein
VLVVMAQIRAKGLRPVRTLNCARHGSDLPLISGSSLRREQLSAEIRGDIPRIMLYMQDRVGYLLSRQDQRLFAALNHAALPDFWEIERGWRIKRGRLPH